MSNEDLANYRTTLMNYRSIIWAHTENGLDLAAQTTVLQQGLAELYKPTPDLQVLETKTEELIRSVKSVLNGAPRWYRRRWILGLPFLAYDIAWLSILLLIGIFAPSSTLLSIPVSLFVWAGIGGSIFALGVLWKRVSDLKLRRGWVIFFATAPVESVFSGTALVLFFLVGFASISGVQASSGSYFSALVAFIGGFNSRITIQLVRKFAQSLGYSEE